MPIPTKTKTSSTKPGDARSTSATKTVTTTTTRSISKPIQNGKSEERDSNVAIKPAATSEPLSTSPTKSIDAAPNTTMTRSRSIARPTTRSTTAGSTIGQTRKPVSTMPLTKVVSNKAIPDTKAAASTRSSSTSSTVSRPAGSGQKQSNVTASTAPRVPSGHTRTVSTTVSRSKPGTSTEPVLSTRSSRTRRDVSNNSTTSSISTGAKTRHEASPAAVLRTAVPTPTSSSSASASSHLQDEIYQLHLVHNNSHHTLHEFRTSIEHTLAVKKGQLRHQQDELTRLETANQEAVSIKALGDWLDTVTVRAHTSPGNQVQLLSDVLTQLAALSGCDNNNREKQQALEPLSRFEEWLTNTLRVLADRDSHDPLPKEIEFVSSLGPHWSEQMRELRQRLVALMATLDSFDYQPEPMSQSSGISLVLTRQRLFVTTLLQEVETALNIEQAIMRAERVWEKAQLDIAITHLSLEDEHADTKDYAGIWARA